MRVVIEDEAFALQEEGASLAWMGLFDLIGQRAHGVDLDQGGARFVEFLEALPASLRLDVLRVLRDGAIREANHPSSIELVIAQTSSPLEGRYTPMDARRALGSSLALVLEDLEDDWSFVRSVASKEQRETLDKAVRDERLVVEHGGGSRQPSIVEREAQARQAAPPGRVFALMDSDGLFPGQVSVDRQGHARRCVAVTGQDRVHVLRRRAIENYLPEPALEAWANDSQGESAAEKDRRLKAWRQLSDRMKHHHNMKKGLGGDSGRIHEEVTRGRLNSDLCAPHPERERMTILAPYAALDPDTRAALHEGFGNNIATYFTQHAAWYASEASWPPPEVATELRPFIHRILSAL